jgi:hypothetical protein
MDADVTNLSWPADDNGTILNRTITYITTNYINKGLPTDDLFVIIGWSSPERNVFWYKDDEISRRFRLWPQVKHFDAPVQEEFWKFYVTYLWNPEEYLPRYAMNVLQLQNFCEVNNIKWMCFNSFYQTPAMNVEQWYDLDIKTELSNLRLDGAHIYNTELKRRLHHQFEYNSIWESINNVRFYKKDVELEMLDPTGVVIEKWQLQGTMLTNVNFGDLSMDDDGIADITADMRFDRAILLF